MHSKHKKPTRDKMEPMFPVDKWSSRKKETFVLACLHIMFYKTPSSYASLVTELRAFDIKKVAKFKHLIVYYADYMRKDVSYLKEAYGSGINTQNVLSAFVNKDIEFYTAWWFIKLNDEDFKPNRTYTHLLNRLKFIMLFLTFKEESIQNIKTLFNQFEL